MSKLLYTNAHSNICIDGGAASTAKVVELASSMDIAPEDMQEF